MGLVVINKFVVVVVWEKEMRTVCYANISVVFSEIFMKKKYLQKTTTLPLFYRQFFLNNNRVLIRKHSENVKGNP